MKLLIYGAIVMLASTIVNANEEDEALAFLARFNKKAPIEENKKETSGWNFWTNITPATQSLKNQGLLRFFKFREDSKTAASRFNVAKLSEDTRRQIQLIKAASIVPRDTNKRQTLTQKSSQMVEIYSSAKVNDPLIGKNLSLDPHLVGLMANSRNYSVLLAAWRGWRDATGPKIRPLYEEFVKLSNEGARENNYANKADYRKSKYEVADLDSIVEDVWKQLQPFYLELHAYVRDRLSEQYPVFPSQPIPAHVLGNMWSQSWSNIYPLVEPHYGKPSLDVTKSLKKQNYTALRIVKLTESFFESIGLGQLPGSFYQTSMFERPKDREVVCHAAASDFYVKNARNEKDVRIKQCISITHGDLITTHHEIGHVYYFLQYWDQPYIYRDGANPAFHEAVGDTISLSVDNPQHLVDIKLLDNYTEDPEADVNALMKKALSKVAFMPYGYTLEKWRNQVFSGAIKPSDYNTKWWEMRVKYQGIKAPISRDQSAFDPGAKFHVPADAPYIMYFLSAVLEFQFHKAACKVAGHTGPLHRCSIYNSRQAGEQLSEMLKAGRSKHWQDTLEKFTGTRSIDVNPLKEYFQPLHTWLLRQRCAKKYNIGWSGTPGPNYDPCNPPTFLPPTEPSTAAAQISSRPSAHAPKSAELKLQTIVIVSFIGFVINLLLS